MNNIKAKVNMKTKIQNDTIVCIKEDGYTRSNIVRKEWDLADCPWKSGWLSHNNIIIMNNNGQERNPVASPR